MTSLIPWQSVPKPFLACFCGPALVPLRCDRWYSSSVAVESSLHHSLSIKSGNRQRQGYAARKYQPQASSEDLLHILFPFLSISFPIFKALSLSMSFSIAHKYDPVKLKKNCPLTLCALLGTPNNLFSFQHEIYAGIVYRCWLHLPSPFF